MPSDRHDYFLAALAQTWDVAQTGDFTVRVELGDGSTLQGSPTANATANTHAEEVDDTGVLPLLHLDGEPLDAIDVTSFCVLLGEPS